MLVHEVDTFSPRQRIQRVVKFRFSEKTTKIWKNLPLILTVLSKHQNKWEIFQILWPSHNNVLTLNKHLKNKSGDSSWNSHNPNDISTHAQGYILGHTFWVQLDYRAVNIYRYPQRRSTSTASSRNRAGSNRNMAVRVVEFSSGGYKTGKFLPKN